MPLTINVGLSRKLSQDFNSVGVSINVTAELNTPTEYRKWLTRRP